MPFDFNRQIIEEFRANGGRVGGPFEGARLLLLTTVGAKSGAPHTVPLGYLPDVGGRVLVIASAGGSPKHPAWFHNLLAEPRVKVESTFFDYDATADVLSGDDRDGAFARAVEADPGWGRYEAESGRVLPVVALTPAPAGPPTGPLADYLKTVHDAFRHELRLIREEVASSGPNLGAQLRINCLTFCQGLGNHHLGEDSQMFPFLERDHPELAPALTRLRREHQTIDRLLADLQAALTEPESLLAEVDRLATELEAHLDYEEEHLIPALNATS